MTNQYHFVQLTFLTAQGSLLQYIMGTTAQTMFEPQRHAVRYKATTPKQRLACYLPRHVTFWGPKWWWLERSRGIIYGNNTFFVQNCGYEGATQGYPQTSIWDLGIQVKYLSMLQSGQIPHKNNNLLHRQTTKCAGSPGPSTELL